jgi:hypothetical protein
VVECRFVADVGDCVGDERRVCHESGLRGIRSQHGIERRGLLRNRDD